jgi:hypothetical protein
LHRRGRSRTICGVVERRNELVGEDDARVALRGGIEKVEQLLLAV